MSILRLISVIWKWLLFQIRVTATRYRESLDMWSGSNSLVDGLNYGKMYAMSIVAQQLVELEGCL